MKLFKGKSKPKPSSVTGIAITGATPESINAAREAVNDIVHSSAGDLVKVEALRVLDGLCSVKNTTISNCSVSLGATQS